MGWSPPSPVGLQQHESREGKQRLIFPSVYLCLCRHVKLGTNEWGKAPDLPSDLIYSCAFQYQKLASWLPNSFPLSHGHLPR